jgi:hypothetical protein
LLSIFRFDLLSGCYGAHKPAKQEATKAIRSKEMSQKKITKTHLSFVAAFIDCRMSLNETKISENRTMQQKLRNCHAPHRTKIQKNINFFISGYFS